MDFKIKMLVDYKHLKKGECYNCAIGNNNLNLIYVDTCILNWSECELIHKFDKFVYTYAKEIEKAINFNPSEWPINVLPLELSYRMTLSLKVRTANLSDTARKAAKKLGVKPTYKDIEEYLS